MRRRSAIIALLALAPVLAVADKPAKNNGTPPGLARQGGAPPGLAKKGGLPPGLAKKFGPAPPARAYVAFDPARDDRAWFLIDGAWVLERNFDASLRVEVRGAMALPAVPPPVPLPRLDVAFRVVLFE